MSEPLHVTVIAGPTASGKSAFAVEVAERLGAEIVSADSQQVYRRFELGTAKPTAEEQARVRHHLVSVVDPRAQFTAGEYQLLADAAIRNIAARGKRVVVVGGTGLYLRVLLHGVIDAPGPNPELRRQLTEEGQRNGLQSLHARLTQVDPVTGAKLSPRDGVRIIRALEIFLQSGKSALHSPRRTPVQGTPLYL